MSKKTVIITASEVLFVIALVKKGEFFSLFFDRAYPKCPACGKADKRWHGLTYCPICGEALSFQRETVAQIGVENPHDKADTPKGTGVGFCEALINGVLKFYDVNAINPRGGKGGYRSCRIENIRRITLRGVDYIVK